MLTAETGTSLGKVVDVMEASRTNDVCFQTPHLLTFIARIHFHSAKQQACAFNKVHFILIKCQRCLPVYTFAGRPEPHLSKPPRL